MLKLLDTHTVVGISHSFMQVKLEPEGILS